MIENYLTITFRNIVRNKLFSAINILGLSVSLACCLLLFLYISEQLSYDEHHGKSLYRINTTFLPKDGESFTAVSSSVPIAPVIEEEIPEIKNTARVLVPSVLGVRDLIAKGDAKFFTDNGYIVDSDFFELFQFDFIAGNRENPLQHSNAIVLEKEMAGKLFGEENPIGKIVKVSSLLGEADLEVTAVYDQETYSSHLKPAYMMSLQNTRWNQFIQRFSSNWVSNNLVNTYVELNNTANPKGAEEKIHGV